MKVTLFHRKDHTEISVIEWTELMQRIRKGYWRDIVEKCRKEAIGGDELKKRLPAFGVSVTFTGGDEAANVVGYNHIIGIDFNKVLSRDDKSMDKIDECRNICHDIPSVVGFYVTKSGLGFRLFVLVNTGIDEHKIIYHPLQEYFENLFSLQADDKYMDITRLSFVTYDADCLYRTIEEAEPFDMGKLVPEIKKRKEQKKIEALEDKVCKYLTKIYDFRYNKREHVVQIRLRGDNKNILPASSCWKDVDDRQFDTIVNTINNECARITYNQFKWIYDNDLVKQEFDPLKEFDSQLSDWDNHDYIDDYISQLHFQDRDKYIELFRIWVAMMYRSWNNPEKNNNRILSLETTEANTGKTEWLINLLPPVLRRYCVATSLDFIPDDMSKYLLMIIEDYDGRNTDKIKKILSSVHHPSIVFTTSRPVNLHDRDLDIVRFVVHKKDGDDIHVPIDYFNFYSQIKYLASK